MSSQVDDRIVQMQFENQSFERNIGQTINSLNELDNSLNNLAISAAESLDNFSLDESNFHLENISRGIDAISGKFTALGIAGVTALVRITNQAIDTGERLVKSLSVDQITAGWNKYNRKTASVQAIVNATGKSVQEVNKYLDELMWFSDETSYGFTDMTAALGMLTSAGGDVRELVPMIEGVANATALAGKGVNEFSRAMYNLNQSYSIGSLQYMDWRSLELAGVASAQLKEELIRVGEEQGKIAKGSVDVGNFATTLKDRWADREVMEEAFGNFAKYSQMAFGMVKSGQFDTASEAYDHLARSYNDIYLTAAKAAQEAKSFAEAIDATKDAVSSGWMKTFEIIFGDYEEAKRLWTDLANTLWDVFASGAEERNAMLQEWKDMGGRTSILKSISNIWEQIVNVVSAIKDGFREIFPKTTAEQIYNITKAFENWTERISVTDESLENIKQTVKGFSIILSALLTPIGYIAKMAYNLIAALSPVSIAFFQITGAIGEFISKIYDAVVAMQPLGRIFEATSNSISQLVEGIQNRIDAFRNIDTSGLEDGVQKVSDAISPLDYLISGIATIFDGVVRAIEATGNVFYNIGQLIGGAISAVGTGMLEAINVLDFDKVKELINTFVYSSILVSANNFLRSLSGIASSLKTTIGGVKSFSGAILETIAMMQNRLQADIIVKQAKALLILGAAFLLLSTIDSDALTNASVAIGVLVASMNSMLAALLPLVKNSSFALSANLFSLGTVFFSFATSLLVLSLAVKQFASLDWDEIARGLVAISVVTLGLTKAMSALPVVTKGTKVASAGLISLAAAILILSKAVEVFSAISWEGLIKGLLSVSAILGSLVVFVKVAEGTAGIKAPVGLIALASSVLILSKAMETIAKIDSNLIGKALLAITALVANVAVFTKVANGTKGVIAASTGMIALAAAMNVIAIALKKIGSIPTQELVSGLTAVGVALAEMTLALNLITPGKVLGKSVAMVALASSVAILSNAVIDFSKLSWEEIAKSLVTLGGSVGILAVGLRAMQGTINGSLAITAAAVALTLMAAPLKIFSTFNLTGLAMAMGVLAATFAVFGGAAALLTPTIPAMLGLAAAFALLGIGIGAIGTGLVSIGAGLTSIAAAVAVSSVSISDFIDAFIQTIPNLIVSVGKGITKVVQVLAEAIPVFEKFLTEGAHALIRVLGDLAPDILDAVLNFLKLILDKLPEFINTGSDLVIAFLAGMTRELPKIVTAAVDFVLGFIGGIATNLYRVVNAGVDFIITFIDAIGKAIAERTGDIVDAVIGLGKNIVIGLKTGIFDKVEDLIKSVRAKMLETGHNIMQGLIDGIKNKAKDLRDTAVNTVKNMWESVKDFLGIHSPSTLFKEIGENTIAGFSLGFEGSTSQLTDSAKKVLNELLTEFSQGVPIFQNMGSDLMSSLYSGIEARLKELDDEEEKRQKQQEEADKIEETRQNLRDAIRKTNQAVKGGDAGFDNGAAIQKYLKELGYNLSGEEDAIAKAAAEERERLNALKTSIEETLVQSANQEYLSKLNALLEKEGKVRGTFKESAEETAEETIKTLANTIDAQKGKVSASMKRVVKASDKTEEMKQVGISMALGMRWGINEKVQEVATAAAKMAKAAYSAAKMAIDSNSPSKLFMQLGRFADEGFAIGISKNESVAVKSASNLGTATLEALSKTLSDKSDLISDMLGISPVITPVLDLSNVRRMSDAIKFDDATIGVRGKADRISIGSEALRTAQQPVTQNITNENTFTFNQTNNSPKGLSRLDIYRQTKNQFSMFKQEVLNGVPASYGY